MTDVDQALYRTNLAVLNRLRPAAFDYIVMQPKEGYDQKKLDDFLFYYEKVAQVVPNRADAYGLLGYCHFHQGSEQEAIASYKKAIELNPKFFWFHHNLGVIYFSQGEYEKAVESWERGLKTDLKGSVTFIARSARLYLPLLGIKHPIPQSIIKKELEEGYKQTFLGIALAKQNNKPNQILNLYLY